MPILSAQSKLGTKAVLGPFMIQEYKPGVESYWCAIRITGSATHKAEIAVPRSVRLPIQQNRETELARFRRGDSN